MIQPPYLKKGDTIGLTCPAGYIEKEKTANCIAALQEWGYEVMVGNTIGSLSDNYFSGTDEQRRDELQAMLDDDSIKAILCGRGGYGLGRIIDSLDFRQFRKHPKWIIGFSDITVLHCHLNRRLQTASLHAPMAGAFNGGHEEAIQHLRFILSGGKIKYTVAPHLFNQPGKASGELVGGNLALLVNLIGTPSALRTENKILFIEDTGEYIYAIDRMFHQLKRSGQLEQLAGLIIGGFTDVKDTIRPFGKTVYEAIHAITRNYRYPVCFGFPVSHGKENLPLKSGVLHRLSITRTGVSLSEQRH